jgi:hypothetical protein
VLTDCLVTKVIVEHGRATGVRCRQRGAEREARARQEWS